MCNDMPWGRTKEIETWLDNLARQRAKWITEEVSEEMVFVQLKKFATDIAVKCADVAEKAEEHTGNFPAFSAIDIAFDLKLEE